MRFRKLRIAWSVFWGVACVLLIVLWVRSYYVSDQAFMRVSTLTGYNFTSMQGQLTLRREAIDTRGIGFYGTMGIPDYLWNSFPPRAFLRYRTIFGFDLRQLPNFIIFPYWAPVFVCALLAPAPYLNRRKLTRF